MSEWWTYGLSDFLMYSARTHGRLLAHYHRDLWPAGQVLALAAGLVLLGLLGLLRRPHAASQRAALVLLAAAWMWLAWGYFWQRRSEIDWAARYYAAAFAVQALLMLASGARRHMPARTTAPAGVAGTDPASLTAYRAGLAGLAFAVVVNPLLPALWGQPWDQAPLFGLLPDATVLATLAVMLLLAPAAHWLLWVVALLWCAVGGATAWLLGAPDFWLLPAAGAAAAGLAAAGARRRSIWPAASRCASSGPH